MVLTLHSSSLFLMFSQQISLLSCFKDWCIRLGHSVDCVYEVMLFLLMKCSIMLFMLKIGFAWFIVVIHSVSKETATCNRAKKLYLQHSARYLFIRFVNFSCFMLGITSIRLPQNTTLISSQRQFWWCSTGIAAKVKVSLFCLTVATTLNHNSSVLSGKKTNLEVSGDMVMMW